MEHECDHNRYELRLTHKHVRVLIHALDIYTRTAIGQFERLSEDNYNITPETRRHCNALFDQIKMIMYGMQPNESQSICSHELHEFVHIGYEIEKTLQKFIAEVEDHHHWSVWRDGPMRLSTEPFPKIKPETESTDAIPFRQRRLKGIHPGDTVTTRRYVRRTQNKRRYNIRAHSTGIVEEVNGHQIIVRFPCLDTSLPIWDTEVTIIDEDV